MAFRNLIRHKGFSFINIAGLTLGLTAVILIALFVRDEKQYDAFVPEGDQVYRIFNEYTGDEGTSNFAVAAPMFATALKQSFPEVEQTARILMLPQTKTLFEAGTKRLYEESGLFADSTFFDVLPLTFTHGSPAKALDAPASIVLSNEMAQRYFGSENPVGKELLINKTPVSVTGVFQTNPKFHLQFDYVLPLSAAALPPERMQKWTWQQFYTYVKLKPGTDAQALENKFFPIVKRETERTSDDHKNSNHPHFQALRDIHLYSAAFKYDNAVRGNITYVKALTIIALFILLIACFNFVNLATAKSMQRANEVGVRKSIGASRQQLMLQFTGETILLTAISVIFSVALTFFFLPALNRFTGKTITFDLFTNPIISIILLLLTVIVGVVAGFYPALVLSGFQPVKVLKGNVVSDALPGKTPWLRHTLVVAQFSLSVLLIISALVVFRQVNYLHSKDLGFNKEQIMFFPLRGENLAKNNETFKNDLLQSPGIAAVSIGYGFPGDAIAGDGIIVPRNGARNSLAASLLMTDYDYIKTLGLQLVAGRDFSKEMQTDKDHAFIINETAVKEMGFGTPEKAVGQPLLWPVWGAQDPDSLKEGRVIGVVKDFHYKSLYDKVGTAVLQIFPDAAFKVAVKMKTAGIENTIAFVKREWNKYAPDYPLEYKFLDENFEAMYQAEDQLRSLLWTFTFVAIFVGCLGLFGLAAYTAERRTKEIGIRKVLGASVQELVVLLSNDFVKLVVIALLLASPVAWYFMHRWLQDFAYRIAISWWIFVAAGAVAILIALLTVSFQAVKAALSNPVKSLRTE